MKKLFPILLLFLLFSCTTQKEIQEAAYPDLFDGKYDSEFPYRSSSEQLEEISRTIRLVNSIAFYKTFYFEPSRRMTMSEIRRDTYRRQAFKTGAFEETASGTGTVIYNFANQIGVLTCSHIISFPDSVTTFYKDELGRNTGLIESISIIQKRNIYFVPFPENSGMEVVLNDKQLDVAILKTELTDSESARKVETFNHKLGRASELDWGSFVYVFGFPLNYKMISKGIVSNPNNDGKGSFLIDAVFSEGYSGGIVLAIRDGVPNFELVGMVKSVPAEYEYVVKPKEEEDIILGAEYDGELIVDYRANIKYGVTRILSIETILKFLETNSNLLREAAFEPERLFE